jgi:hypothetical protein
VFTVRATNGYSARKHIACLLYVPLVAITRKHIACLLYVPLVAIARKRIAWLLYVPLMAIVLANISRIYSMCRQWLQCSETNRVATVRAANGYSAPKQIA